ncbi:MAG: valine--tRNA ligase [Candidatus Paceibacterota bacterium]
MEGLNDKNKDSAASKEKDRYNPFEKEKYWQDFWEEKNIYKFNPDSLGDLFTIDTPPPTVSGALHLGHIYSYIHAEVISRFKRMQGANVRYPFGLDNNGLPTERLVEKEIKARAQDMELEEFVGKCLETTEKYKEIYENLWKSIGLSVDWSAAYSTISLEVQKLSQSVFKELYEKGVIYKKNAPALYCPECQTSFAQAEKEDKEKEAVFYDLIFKVENGDDLVIATTRPELLPACVAVFVNPKDGRYKGLKGKKVKTPLGQEVEILADEKVDPEKGSGAVMCCTYGDETDIYWAKIYSLPEKIILDKSGKLQNTDEFLGINGKPVYEARKIIVEKLKEKEAVKKEEKIVHSVGVHERCGTPVEFLSTTQWFIKLLDKKEELLKAGKQINWRPDYMGKRYEEWVAGLKWDWCISRERFYGIPVPVFSCDKCGEIFIPDESEFPIDPKKEKKEKQCPGCKEGKLVPDRNILDTWFTSSLTPDINNLHPLNGKLQGKMYPMSMRPQAHDIIRTWAVYSVLMGLYRHDAAPWKDLMISGHILLRKGEKISKKTGGGKYKPEEMIAEHSADALRYAMCGVALGKDAYYDEKEVKKGKKLATKLYNAGKLVLSNVQDFDAKEKISKENLEAADKWILQRSFEAGEKMAKAFNEYEYSQARQIFEDFFWQEFCDNYLEIVKGRLSDLSEKGLKGRMSAQFACYQSFLNILKMASPFIPHIAEEMYHADIIKKGQREEEKEVIESKKESGYFYKNEKTASIHISKWPCGNKEDFDENIIAGAEISLFAVSEARKFKSENKIKLREEISLLAIQCPLGKQNLIKPFLADIASVTKAKEIKMEDAEELSIEVKK